MLLLLILSSSGCKEKENLKDRIFSIEEADMNQEFGSTPENKIILIKTNLSLNDWKAESEANWLFLSTQEDASQGASLKISATANTSGERRTAVVKLLSPVQNYILNVTQYGSSDIVLSEDIKVQPSGGKASEFQPGQGIENTWDGKFSADGANPYHSVWGQSANFPVTLEYYFQGGADIDYLIYYTRAGNGNFGELDLLIATDEGHSNWTKYGTYNFRMQNAPSKISFKTTQKVTGIKFEVKSGAGNFVSCDEMEFYRYNQENTLENTLLTVFSDVTCSALKEGVTDEQINALPDYFVRLAKALQNNTYDPHEKEFRIREYAPYSIPEEWATKLMTKKYSNLDNPTGISVQQGDEIIVLVGDTHGQQISLQSIWESGEEYKQTNVSGEVYFLSPGINKLTMRKEGQLFVMYNTDLTSPDAQPVKIHIPMGSGKVTGFFDLKEAEAYAAKVGKPLFIDFTGHGCVNCREMEARVWSDPQVLDILRNDYVIVALYSDDKKVLPESEWVTTDAGKVLKSLGKINSYYALKTFGVNAQPYYVLQGRGGKELAPPRGYDLDVQGFVDFLRSGVEAYDRQK